MSGPLSGLRVVDLTSTLLAPYCSMNLGDLGAEVVKVEPPTGDVTRHLGTAKNPSMASGFLSVNRGKRSVVLDLKRSEGLEVFRQLIADSDVFVHNMRADAIGRLGLTHEDLRKVNPSLIYATATGFGSDGPYAGRPAYDDIIQASCGLAALQGEVTGSDPTYVGTVLVDKAVGLAMTIAVLAAIVHRERTGEGQQIEVPMFETMVPFLLLEHLGGHSFEPPIGPARYSRLITQHRRPYRTSDGFLAVVVYTDRHWERFLDHIGRRDLLDDERYATTAARSTNIDGLYAVVADELVLRTTDEWLRTMDELDIPAARVNTIEDLFDDPHLAATQVFRTAEHPTEGTVRWMSPSYRFSRTPIEPGELAPSLGQHSRAVLSGLGYDDESIDDLTSLGVLGTHVGPDAGTTAT